MNYYRDIQNQPGLDRIEANHRTILRSLGRSFGNFLILQGAIACLAILGAASLFALLKVNYLQIGIFRFGVLGAFFHVISLFMIIILYYFDSWRCGVVFRRMGLVTF